MSVCEDLVVYSVTGLQLCLQALEEVSIKDVVFELGSIMWFGANNNEVSVEFLRYSVSQETDLGLLKFYLVKLRLQVINL